MKRIITKAECKQNFASKIKSPNASKTNGINSIAKKYFYNADSLIDEILFSRILFTKRLTLRSGEGNKFFILENCSLYNTRKLINVHP